MKHQYRFLQRSARLPILALVMLSGSWSAGLTQSQLPEKEALETRELANESVAPSDQVPTGLTDLMPGALVQDVYLLGPGDAVMVELLDVPEYSGVFSIGPNGNLYLPRLRSLPVEGLTIKDLRIY